MSWPRRALLLSSLALPLGCTGDDTTTSATLSETSGTTDGTTEPETTEGPGTETSETVTGSMTTEPGECTDGVPDEGEECDDGNDVDDDECSNACIVNAVCGDGVMEGAEECDDGNEIEDDGCTSECLLSEYCGNGVVEEPEKCDDGNDVPMDGCEDNCIPSEPGDCGNGVAEWNEPCDDGNEINDDGCQNDCELTPDPACQPLDGDDDPYAPCDDALVKNQELAPFQALDLACSDLVNQAVFVDDHQFMSNNPNAWQIASGYGSFATMGELKYSPRKGDAMLVLSTGTVAAPNPQGVVLEQPNSQGANGENNNDDTNQLPSAINPVNGSNNGQGGTPFEGCDGFGDCSDTLAAQWGLNGDPNDKLWFRFEATPPPGTAAYSMHLVLCSSEWPVFVNTPYNDLLIIWQVSDEYTGNVTYLNGQALSITSLNDYILTEGYVFADPELGGTGFEGHACTDWLTVKHNVTPDGPLEMTFFLADIGDSILATVALLDGFRWECDACTPGDSLACMSDLPGADCCGVAVPG